MGQASSSFPAAAAGTMNTTSTPIPGSPSPSSSSNIFEGLTSSIRRSFRRHYFLLRRRDSEFSVSSEYDYPSNNDLNIWQGATLLAADCLGTGILALPHDIHVLGTKFGLLFLILNFPINLYAGTILSHAALHVEQQQEDENQQYASTVKNNNNHNDDSFHMDKNVLLLPPTTPVGTTLEFEKDPEDDGDDDDDDDDEEEEYTTTSSSHLLPHSSSDHNNNSKKKPLLYGSSSGNNKNNNHHKMYNSEDRRRLDHGHATLHHDTATFDFIGMTSALFRNNNNNSNNNNDNSNNTKRSNKNMATRLVMALFYTNIFLVLGNYILVMSHAVSALFGEERLCIPQAGLLASTLMFAVSQLRTMAKLGRSASVISLTALFIVVVQCLYYSHYNYDSFEKQQVVVQEEDNGPYTILQKLSATGSIGFAVGSQKLFLNIRHELADREAAPTSLAISLTAFGSFYVGAVLIAGKNPPGFLFDAIPPGWSRHVAGFFLWVHVVVSYAINSQAICASMDRIFFYSWKPVKGMPDHYRWMILTGIMATSAFLVANAIPFFKDLLALIGALTSVPLTLLLPAVYHRKVLQVPIWLPTLSSLTSYGLLLFSLLFMVAALGGALDSILSDWRNHTGGFFPCH